MPSTRCPSCDAALTVPESALGRSGRCPACRTSFVVRADPAPDTAGDGPPLAEDQPADPALSSPAGGGRGPRTADPDSTRKDVGRDRPDKPRRRGGGKKKRPPAARVPLPRWVWAAGGGGVLLLVGLIGLIWLGFGRGGGGGGDGGVGEVVAAAAQEPQPGTNSWVSPVPVPAVERATWKVTPDPAPLAAGLGSEFSLPDGDVRAVLLAGPSAKAAAVRVLPEGPPAKEDVVRGRGTKRIVPRIEWIRYDLHKPEPVGRVPILPAEYPPSAQTKVEAALSPSGERLAVAVAGDVRVCSSDGAEVASFRVPVNQLSGAAEWSGFAGEDRLLTLADRRVSAHDPASGRPLFVLPAEFRAPPVLSPGGKGVVAYTGAGYEFFGTADGRKAGVLPLPSRWEDRGRPRGGLAFHPDGKRVAGLTTNSQGQMLVTVWDVSDGALKESLVVSAAYDGASGFDLPVAWAGDRRLVFGSGEVLDLDLRTAICKYELPRPPLPVTGPSPDGRTWRVAGRPGADGKGAAGGERGASGAGRVLAASTLPHPGATARLDAARKGILWHPGAPLRVEVDGSVPPDQRETLLQVMSESVTKAGLRVDPAAKLRMTVHVKTKRGKVDGKAMKGTFRGGPAEVQYQVEVVDGFILDARFEITDGSGRPVMRLPYSGMGVSAPDYEGKGQEELWRRFRDQTRQGLRFPRLFLRDANGALLPAKQLFSPGIDGREEPAALPLRGDSGTAEFQLPGDAQ